jgi:hypothetical protein
MAELEKATAEKTIRNILDSRREFLYEDEDGNETSYFISSPTGEDVRKADWNYAKVFNQAIDDGFPTQAQMLETLQKRGILSDEYARKVEMTKINLGAALFRLENLSDRSEDTDKETLALEIARLRDELFTLNQKVSSPMGNTCENTAEDARVEYLTSRVVQTKEGKRLWPTFDAYLNEPNNRLAVKSRFEVMLYLQGLESNFLENTPERQTLREIAERRLNEAVESAQNTPADDNSQEVEVENISLPDEPKPKRRGRAKKPE